MTKEPRILCVFWHRVESNPIPSDFLDGSDPPASLFKSHIEFLVRNYVPISIWDFLEIMEGEKSIRSYDRPPVLLGFDDGFRSVVVNGLPILTEFGVPATFFVVAEAIRDPDFLPWFVEVTHVIRKAKHKRVVYRDVELDLSSRLDAIRARRLFEGTFRAACRSEEERQHHLKDFANLLGVHRPAAAELDEDLRFVSKEDLALLAASSSSILTVASHGMTHRHLASLGYDEQRYELNQSDSVLREHCPSYCPVIAYPSGSFNAATIAIARGIYRAGFAVFLDSSYRNRYAYPRVSLGGCTVQELAYSVSSLRLNLLLPLKRGLHRTGLRRI